MFAKHSVPGGQSAPAHVWFVPLHPLLPVTHAHPHYHWTFAPAILFPIAVYAWLWLRRYVAVRRESGPRGAGPRQLAAFIGAILVLLLALVSPLDRLGEDYLFSAHMVQHLLLGDIAPLLLLLSLSRVIMRPLTRRLQERFDQAVRGESARESWTTPVYSPMPVNGVVGHASVGDR